MVLERLAQQTYPASAFKVVLSDDGSSDGLPDMIESIRHELPFEINLLQNKHQGPAGTHNAGIRACDDGIVIMMAADILATPDFVKAHIETHTNNPAKNVVVVGKLRQSKELPQTTFQKSWDKLVNHLFSKEKNNLKHQGFFVSNLSFKKHFMVENGMFLNWPPAAQEDIELGYRLLNRGMRLLTNKQALGYHHHEATLNGVAKRAYMEGYNWHFFSTKVQNLWVRTKSNQLDWSDGAWFFVRSRIKRILHKGLLNRFTLFHLIIPTIKAAEKHRGFEFVVPLLAGKVASYYFYLGMKDFKHNILLNSRKISL